jgi:hypothetical protein
VSDTTTRVTLSADIKLPEHAGKECLVALYGTSIGKKHELTPGLTTLGRDPLATIILEADSVSRTHARIEIDRGETWISDLGSTNGTFVNGERIAMETRLSPGDEVAVGSTHMIFEPSA